MLFRIDLWEGTVDGVGKFKLKFAEQDSKEFTRIEIVLDTQDAWFLWDADRQFDHLLCPCRAGSRNRPSYSALTMR